MSMFTKSLSYCQQHHDQRWQRTLGILALLIVLLALFTKAAFAANPVPVQTFYIPLPENHVFSALSSIYPGNVTCNRSVSEVANPITSITSLATIANGTVIYFDQWEDGYEADIANPTQSSTQIWGDGDLTNGIAPGQADDRIDAGDVVILNNNVDSTTRQAVVDFDGGDKIAVSKTVAVTRAVWSTGPRTLMAGGVAVVDTSNWGTQYTIPVGQNASVNEIFQYVGISVMASQDNTVVNIDVDANGSAETTVTLNQGQSYLVNGGIQLGATINASAPVQVDIITGDVCATYESRWFLLYPSADWGNDYYAPVSTGSDAPTLVWLYNPGPNAITINWETMSGAQTPVTIPANGSAQVQLADGTGAHFASSNGAPFYAVSTISAQGTQGATPDNSSRNDWGYSLLPDSLLTPQILIGWGPGRDPTSTINTSENSSPVWLTPVLPAGGSGSVNICVDYDGDGGPLTDIYGSGYDQLLTINALQSVKIYDPDGDQTNMVVYVCDNSGAKLAAAYGQDPDTASAGQPAIDLGTTVPPLPLASVTKEYELAVDADGNGIASTGDTLRYTIYVNNISRVPVPDVKVSDTVPANTQYVTGSTTLTSGTTTTPIADSGTTPIPLDEGGVNLGSLAVNSQFAVSFAVKVAPAPGACLNPLVNTATVNAGGEFVPTVSTPLVCSPRITIQKTVYTGHNSGASCPGGELVSQVNGTPVTYCFVVTNTGDTYLNGITINDSDLGITQAQMTVKSGTQPLAPGASLVYYYQGAINGDLLNRANTTGTPTNAQGTALPNLSKPTASDTASVDEVAPAIDLQKTVYLGHNSGASCPGGVESVTTGNGAAVTYCFVVKNTGNTHLNGITLNDATLNITQAQLTLKSGSQPLAPGASLVYHYQTTVQGDLLNRASTTGTATNATGVPLPGLPNVTDDDTANVNEVAAAIDLQKTVYAGHNSGASCPGSELVSANTGAAITYCFKVTNTGETYLKNITLTDADLGISQAQMTLKSGTQPLAPGASLVYYYQTTVQRDLVNHASTTGTPSNSTGGTINGVSNPSDDDTASVNLVAPGLELQKTVYSGHNSGGSCPGSELVTTGAGAAVTYCFIVTNTGDTHLNNITLADPDLNITQANLTLKSGTQPLAPGASLVYYYQTTVQGDLVNRASSSGTPTDPSGTPLPNVPAPQATDTATVNQVAPGITLEKTVYVGHNNGASCPGQDVVTAGTNVQITYCFKVINSGETHLNGITVSDPTLGINLSSNTRLAPGQSVMLFHQSTLTGTQLNTATATGPATDSSGNPIPGVTNPSDDDKAEVASVAAAINLQKTVYLGHNNGASCPGSELVSAGSGANITYCFLVTNTGNTYLNGITVSDPSLNLNLSNNTRLAPGQSVTLFAQTTLTVDRLNTATATGPATDSSGNPIPGVGNPSDDDTARVDLLAPAIDLQKSVYIGHNSGASCPGAEAVTAGQNTPITYCFVVTNRGDTYLNGVTVTDPLLGVTLNNSTRLAPGQSVTLFAQSTLTVDRVNTAQATGPATDSSGNPIPNVTNPTATDTAQVDEVIAAIELAKSVYLGHNGGASCPGSETVTAGQGSAITYCFVVTNAGGTYLNGVTVSDSTLGITLNSTVRLAPGQKVTLFHESSLTGDVVNTATATGPATDSSGNPIPGVSNPTDDDTARTEESTASLKLQKTVYLGHNAGASCPGGELVEAGNGANVTYCFVVTNTGATYINGVTVNDPALNTTLNANVLLAPGQSVTLVYQTRLSGDLLNTATATGPATDSSRNPIPGVPNPTDSDTSRVNQVEPKINLQKTVYLGHNSGSGCPGEELLTAGQNVPITYCFVVTNTGNTWLNNVTLSDATLGINQAQMTLLSGSQPLAPGASLVYSYQSQTTQDLVNTASTTGDPIYANGNPVPNASKPTASDTAEVNVVTPGLVLEKTVYAGHNGGALCPGVELVEGPRNTAVTFCLVAVNTGDITLNGITVSDPALGVVFLSPVPLAPGERVTFYYETTIQGDLVNTATATGSATNEQGNPIPGVPNPTDTATVHQLTFGSIGDTIWRDSDGDGVQDLNEPGLSGVKLTLVDANGNVVQTVTTDANGHYLFTGVPAGSYTVKVDPSTLPAGYTQTGDPDGVKDHQTSVTLTPGQVVDNADFGYQQPTAVIGNLVWNDRDGDGTQDEDEPGLPGIVVKLYDAQGNLVKETTTDANGVYEFSELPAGNYVVVFVKPETFTFTAPGAGGDPRQDSDADIHTGQTGVITVSTGQTILTVDAGLFAPPVLHVVKSDGLQPGTAVQPGSPLVYTIEYSNTGYSDATGVVITEIVPQYTTVDLAQSAPGWVCQPPNANGQATCTYPIGTVKAGTRGTVALVFKVYVDKNLPLDVSAIVNQVSIQDDGTHGEVPGGATVDTVTTPVDRPTAIEEVAEPLNPAWTNRVFLAVVQR